MQWTRLDNPIIIPNYQYHPQNLPLQNRLKWTTCNEIPSKDLFLLLKSLPCVRLFSTWPDLEDFLSQRVSNSYFEVLSVENVFFIEDIEEAKKQLYKYAFESKIRMFDQNKKEYENICWYMQTFSFIPMISYFYRQRYLQLTNIKSQIEYEAILFAKYISEQFKEMTINIHASHILFYLIT